MSASPRRRLPINAVALIALALLVSAALAPGHARAQEPATCSPVLVAHTPDGSEGEVRAVAITAQAIDAEAGDVWFNVAWQAAAEVELSAITVLGADGTIREQTQELQQGTAQDVTALWFCGTLAPEAFPDEDPATNDDAPDGTDADTPDAGEAASDGADQEPDDAEPADDNAEQEEDPTRVPAPAPPATAADEDVDVLGVVLSRDDEPAGPTLPITVVMLGLGLLALGTAFTLWRSWPAR